MIEPIDVELVEKRAIGLSQVLEVYGLEANDVYDQMLEDTRSIARQVLASRVFGVQSSLCVGFAADNDLSGDTVTGPMASFVGVFKDVSVIFAPEDQIKLRDYASDVEVSPVPALVFDPVDLQDLPERIHENYPGGVSLYHLVGVPLIGSLVRYVPLALLYTD